MKDSKVIAVMLVVFMLLLMTIGVLFMVRPGVIDNRRAAKEAEIIAMIEASGGSVEIPDMQLPEVQGEEETITTMISRLRAGTFVAIDSMTQAEVPLREDEREFRITG